jgi:hypothetical protein
VLDSHHGEMLKPVRQLCVFFCLYVASAAVAEEHDYRFEFGHHPVGFQAALAPAVVYGFHSDIEFSGRVWRGRRVSVWIGGGLGITGDSIEAPPWFSRYAGFPSSGNQWDWSLLTRMTFDQILRGHLVPSLSLALAGENLSFPDGFPDVYAFQVRLGSGLYYFFHPVIGLGFDTHLALGPAFWPVSRFDRTISPCGSPCVRFNGSWDAEFAIRLRW